MQPSHTEDSLQPTTQGSSPQPESISRETPPDRIASLLVQHGVTDITDKFDFERSDSKPLEGGGFSSVYQGKLQNGDLVAIKRIDKQRVPGLGDKHCKHAAHEIYTWSKCDYPGVLKVLGFVLSEGYILLISPWIKNGSLSSHLMHNRPCDKLGICIDLAGTLEYLHKKGIVHGDIKADNVLVSDLGDVQLGDFGNATLIDFRFTMKKHKAPEILDDSIQWHTTESDIYALGMVFPSFKTYNQINQGILGSKS
ncbi:unnamed protein product [Rhizoctonia solani]|uniref:Protein kinase domain-containing protein n=1 Tax=Rhizoctonia solani TaxID=456999 RepID=A0A8H3D838_9AGAM|nr:unnamed protein product [Rhizoctonia solani]